MTTRPPPRALGAAEIVTQLSRLNGEQVPGWLLLDGALQKSFAFADFYETMAFVNAVAYIAHTERHHPDLALGERRCTLRFMTHSVNGLSASDFDCARRVDALLS